MGDQIREACGVFGIYAPRLDVARLTFYGLFALQHRGQESAGICASDGSSLKLRTGMGLVAQVFDEEALEPLQGIAAIGHTRYSTTGSSRYRNAQPLLMQGPEGRLALAHNGNIVNAAQIRANLESEGHQFETSTDTEIIGKYLLSLAGTWAERFAAMMRTFSGAYSLTLLTPTSVMAARDPLGVRPLCIGQIDDSYVVASETCALDHIGAEFVRYVEPGELITIDEHGLKSEQVAVPTQPAGCIFEQIYIARPDSKLDGQLAYTARLAMGAELARESHDVEADLVIGVPDSATAHAVGYAQESGVPYVEGLVRNRYVGRTFIQPDQLLRERGVGLKFNPLAEVISGKRLIVVDDSIVRGTTTPRIVQLLRAAGAAEIHVRITAPPIRHACFFGVDMATRGELIASHHTVEEVREHIGADSLAYLSIEGLRRAVSGKESHCEACFTGDYPVPVQLEMDKLALEHDDLGMEGDSPRGVANVAVFSSPNTDAIEEEARG